MFDSSVNNFFLKKSLFFALSPAELLGRGCQLSSLTGSFHPEKAIVRAGNADRALIMVLSTAASQLEIC